MNGYEGRGERIQVINKCLVVAENTYKGEIKRAEKD